MLTLALEVGGRESPFHETALRRGCLHLVQFLLVLFGRKLLEKRQMFQELLKLGLLV